MSAHSNITQLRKAEDIADHLHSTLADFLGDNHPCAIDALRISSLIFASICDTEQLLSDMQHGNHAD